MNANTNSASPLVSILIPVYNVERYVQQALDSIASQTYANLQVIVVDDCSTDSTAEIVERFCERDPRFVLLKNVTNLHIAKALNRALSEATGEYIARCDGDDVMEPDRIQRQLDYLHTHSDVALVGCSLVFIDESNAEISRYAFPSGTALTSHLLRYSTAVSHIWLCRREVYDQVGPYRIPTVEDYDFLLRADLAGFKLDNIPNYFGMKIRVRTDNTVGKYGIVQRKLFNYARRVHAAERRGLDVYAERSVQHIIENGREGVLARLHYASDKVSYMASIRPKGLPKYLLIAVAAAISPYKFQYYLNAALRMYVVRKHRRVST